MIRNHLGMILARSLSRPSAHRLMDTIYRLCLRSRGYNNFRTFSDSGELAFARLELKPLGAFSCLDIGANVGDYTRLLLTETEARVVAFEPTRNAYSKLETLAEVEGVRLSVVNKALGNCVGTSTIRYNPGKSSQATLVEQNAYVPESELTVHELVEVETLSAWLAANPVSNLQLIKIDVEGYEREVLEGAGDAIARLRPKFIQVEMTPVHLRRSVSLYLLSTYLNGYDCFQLTPHGMVRRVPTDPAANIFEYANFVFSRIDD